mgnify:CR=1 FL=1
MARRAVHAGTRTDARGSVDGARETESALADAWGFGKDSLKAAGASRIIFTNGLNDGWSVGSITTSLGDTLPALNMPNGAHHSDLSHRIPGPWDTSDVVEAREVEVVAAGVGPQVVFRCGAAACVVHCAPVGARLVHERLQRVTNEQQVQCCSSCQMRRPVPHGCKRTRITGGFESE